MYHTQQQSKTQSFSVKKKEEKRSHNINHLCLKVRKG